MAFAISTSTLFAQSRKEIKKLGIKAETVKVIDVVNGKETEYLESEELFDNNGNTISDKKVNKAGTTIKKETNSYNKNNDLTELAEYGENDVLNTKTVITYDGNGEKTEEKTTDGEGKVKEWIKYGYNARGERMYELKLAPDGKTITKSIYSYNNKGLKSDKKIFDSTDKLITHKRYYYRF